MGHTEHRQAFSIAYDGTHRQDDHSIDVSVRVPALQAMSRLVNEAARELANKETYTDLLVVSDFEHKCFNINYELVLHLYEYMRSLLGEEHIRTAKDLLEWLGIIGGPIGGVSLIAFLKWRKGQPVDKSEPDESGNVNVTVRGNGNTIQVNTHVLRLTENPEAMKAARDIFRPVGTHGFDQVDVRLDGHVVETHDREEVQAIVESATVAIAEAAPELAEDDEAPKEAWLSVYSPVFDESANQWRFKLGTDVIYADITDTTIAADALSRGGASPNDAYYVKLQITQPTASGRRPHFKILEVMRFLAAEAALRQTSMDLQPPKKPRRRQGPPRSRTRPKPAE